MWIIYSNIPSYPPSPFAVLNSLTIQFYQKIEISGFLKKKKGIFFPGSFSIFQPFKWSQHCYLFCKVWKNYTFKDISSIPRPFAVRNSSTNHFYQINWGLWIFSKKKIVPSFYRDIHPGDSWPYITLKLAGRAAA